jgi:hypothetical protein
MEKNVRQGALGSWGGLALPDRACYDLTCVVWPGTGGPGLARANAVKSGRGGHSTSLSSDTSICQARVDDNTQNGWDVLQLVNTFVVPN